ncbi:MAG TPA: GNAT family N-acetyltransferase [Mycobacteriales bacterium]|nr:GNAT family N-acetyltransferase [Mycobacteriales bacterium]
MIDRSPVVVRLADATEVRPLRMSVLRPGQPVEASDYDALPDTRHLGAFAGDVVVGCASVFPSPHLEVGDALSLDARSAWQLRGMAVAPERRGTGVGALVLLAAIDLVRLAGAPLMWANARVTALGFYQRLGFMIVGEEFTYGPLRLPHNLIVLPLQEG